MVRVVLLSLFLGVVATHSDALADECPCPISASPFEELSYNDAMMNFVAIDFGLVLEFGLGSSTLDPLARELLDDFVKRKQSVLPISRFVVAVWSDTEGSTRGKTQALVAQRGHSIATYLRSRLGQASITLLDMNLLDDPTTQADVGDSWPAPSIVGIGPREIAALRDAGGPQSAVIMAE